MYKLQNETNRLTSIYYMEGFDIEYCGYPDWYIESKKAVPIGKCLYCGNNIENERKKYCAICSENKLYASPRSLGIRSFVRHIHQKYVFQCTECGKYFRQKLPSGVLIPDFSGIIHHIKPLVLGGEDRENNLTLLCDICHDNKHKKGWKDA